MITDKRVNQRHQVTCYVCGEPGHVVSTCPKRVDYTKKEQAATGSKEVKVCSKIVRGALDCSGQEGYLEIYEYSDESDSTDERTVMADDEFNISVVPGNSNTTSEETVTVNSPILSVDDSETLSVSSRTLTANDSEETLSCSSRTLSVDDSEAVIESLE
ncbi:unnamed protein product [Arctia plantaginis]|uniref:CCHC-type domain-containing protein n=1 Tax=Arctia plantaginis TaxID=874455 RepID=A0A8S1B306_ARCPL|nr:unnamed protein product [Arctia plantaginis]